MVRRTPPRSVSDVPPPGGGPAPAPHPGFLSEEDGHQVYDHYQVGCGLLADGHPAQACVRLEKARRLAPDRCSIRETLGRAYFASGRLTEAEAEFRYVIERAPADDYAHYCLSRTLRRLGRTAEARAYLKLARALRPGDPRYALLRV